MPFVTNLNAQNERGASCGVTASDGIYDPMGGTVTLLAPHGDIVGTGPFSLTFEQGGVPVTIEDMAINPALSNAHEACFVKSISRFSPALTPRTRVEGNPKTDLTGVISPLPWADSFKLGDGMNAVTGGIRASALKPFTLPPVSNRSSSEHYRFVQSESDLSQELELSASGKYNIEGVNVTASASYLRHIRFSELFTSLVAQYESVFDQYDEASTYELTDEAKNEIKNPAQFREKFGDYFIAGYRRFSRFTAVYRCQASSAENMQTFKASLGAEAPAVFSVEGSARFMELASQHKISIEIQIDQHGFNGESPLGPPWTPEKILDQLNWCKAHLGGVPFQTKLMHYSMLAPAYPQTIDIAPSAFVSLRQLYTTVWDVRTRYNSCPPAYQDQFKKEYTSLFEGVEANKSVLVIDGDKRLEYQQLADALYMKLNEVYARLDFYLKVQQAIGTEPRKGEEIVEGTGVQTWLYGYKEYAKSTAVTLATSEVRYSDVWHIGYREHTFEFGPDGNALIVGWQVISNWNDGTNGSWWKEADKNLLGHYAAVHVKSQYDRGCDWTLRVFYVPAKDYLFDTLSSDQTDETSF